MVRLIKLSIHRTLLIAMTITAEPCMTITFLSGSESSLIDPKLIKRDLSQMIKWRLPKNVYDNFVQISASSTLVSIQPLHITVHYTH